MKLPIEISQAEIESFCKQNHIRCLSFFGSVLREDFGQDSDVDVLVEFEPGIRVGYFTLVTIQNDLAELIGHEVDLLTHGALNPRFRQKVLNGAEVVYG